MRLSMSLRTTARLVPAALVLAALPATLSAQSPQPTPQVSTTGPIPFITASAVGEAQVTPDRARISIGVHTQAPTAADASARNARLQRAIIDTLRALGIPQERITTSGYNVHPEQVYDQQTRRSRIVGYNVMNNVVVDIHQVDQVGRALDAALSKGANLVSSLAFYSSQAEEMRRRALANAVEKARRDAEAMARAAGGTIGELIELASGPFVDRPRPMMEMDMSMRAAAAQAVPTPISEGTQTITASVTARWRFHQQR
jgi:uncharacterized protein